MICQQGFSGCVACSVVRLSVEVILHSLLEFSPGVHFAHTALCLFDDVCFLFHPNRSKLMVDDAGSVSTIRDFYFGSSFQLCKCTLRHLQM